MRLIDCHNELAVLNIIPAADITATGNGAGVDLQGYVGVLKVSLNSSAGTGTSPTLDIKLQDSADNTTFADITGKAFSQVTGAASLQHIALDTRAVNRYVRAVKTVTGTTPSFAAAVTAVGQKQVMP